MEHQTIKIKSKVIDGKTKQMIAELDYIYFAKEAKNVESTTDTRERKARG